MQDHKPQTIIKRPLSETVSDYGNKNNVSRRTAGYPARFRTSHPPNTPYKKFSIIEKLGSCSDGTNLGQNMASGAFTKSW